MTIIPVGDEGGRLSSLQNGRIHAVLISEIQRLTAMRMGYREGINYSKLPIEDSVRQFWRGVLYLLRYPDITLRFVEAWVEATHFSKPMPNSVSTS
jgi:hypothetical protein